MRTSPLLVLTSICLAGAASAQNLQFQPRVDFDFAAELPRQLAMADFDHDGNLDLAATNYGLGGGRIDIHFGNGNSDFSSTYEIALNGAESIGLGDWDNDGWMDIAAGITGWAQQAVYLFRNDHTGGFTSAGAIYPIAWSPMGIAAADFDGDGNLDIAVASASSSAALTWFPGNGDMTFGTQHIVPSTYSNSAERLITADFDNDGKPDMAMAHTSGLRVFLNPLPGFQFQNSFDLPVIEHFMSLAAVDVTADGVLDLIALGDSGHFSVWGGAGDGTFALLHEYNFTGYSRDLRVGDLNGDGLSDVMISSFGGIQLFFGQGGGAFNGPQTVASGVEPMAAGLGDWNGDGSLDLAVACNNGGGQAYLSIHEQIPPPPIGVICQPGIGGTSACPCANPPSGPGRGCNNSSATGGAILTASGSYSLAGDTLVFTTSGEKPSAGSMVLQGSALSVAGVAFGQGVRCVAGSLKRLYLKIAVAGAIIAPAAGDLHVAARSAALGDAIAAGSHRYYGVYYRDPTMLGGCPPANGFNITQQLDVVWQP